MPQFKVELTFQGKSSPDADPSLVVEVEANDDVEALRNANAELKIRHPEFNFSSVWCWHIERLSSPRS